MFEQRAVQAADPRFAFQGGQSGPPVQGDNNEGSAAESAAVFVSLSIVFAGFRRVICE